MSYNPEKRTSLFKVNRFVSAYSEKLVVALACDPDGDMTDQSFAEESDINSIMARYQSTGELPVLNEAEAQWLDVTGMDFHEHMQFVVEAQALFDQLPSAVRDRFGNDPSAFLDFTADENNRRELAQMGLLTPEATEAILYPSSASEAPEEGSGGGSGSA